MPAKGSAAVVVIRVGIERVVARRVEEHGRIVAAVDRISDVAAEAAGGVGIAACRTCRPRAGRSCCNCRRNRTCRCPASRKTWPNRCRRWSNRRRWRRSRWPNWNNRAMPRHACQVLAAVVVIRVGIERGVARRIEEHGHIAAAVGRIARCWCRSRRPNRNTRCPPCRPRAGRCCCNPRRHRTCHCPRDRRTAPYLPHGRGIDRGHAVDGDRIARRGIVELPAAVGVKQRSCCRRCCRSGRPCHRRHGRRNC